MSKKSELKNINGVRFGNLTAIGNIFRNKKSIQMCLFKCDCGNEKQIRVHCVSRDCEPTHSCGMCKFSKRGKRGKESKNKDLSDATDDEQLKYLLSEIEN